MIPVSFDYSFDGYHWRPTAKVILTSSDRVSVRTTALLDTGSDVSLFPTVLIPFLGLKMSAMEQRSVVGISGKPEAAFFETVTIDLGSDILVQTEIGFSTGLNLLKLGLLGQRGFFDHFQVCFDLPKRQFTVK